MTEIEEALALLAAPCNDRRFFQRTLKALTLVTQCRWACFSCPDEINQCQKMIAFCDNKQLLPSINYSLQGAPCAAFYNISNPSKHLFYADGLSYKFPQFELLTYINAESYRAEAITKDDGTVIGHILVMDPLSQSESIKSNEFFRLLAQRISSEYQRLKKTNVSNKTSLKLSPRKLIAYINSQLAQAQHLGCLVFNIRTTEITLDLNEHLSLLLNIIEERLINNISKKDRLSIDNNNRFIVLMELNQIPHSVDYQKQLDGFSTRLTQILKSKIEINNQKININVNVNSEIILSPNSYTLI